MGLLAFMGRVRIRSTLVQLERWLLVIFVGAKAYLLWKYWDQPIGFDWGGHVEMVVVPIDRLFLGHDLFQFFYSYHPPLAFLLAKVPYAFGVPVVASVQIVSTLSILLSFLLLRQTLRHLAFLETAEGVALLYLSYAIPVTIYLSRSVNMESILLLCASGVLWCSVHLFVDTPRHAPWYRGLLVATLVGWLAAGLFTKFTGVLLLPLPFLVAWCLGTDRRPRCVIAPVIIAVTAVVAVLPYYYLRYYQATGAWLPSNTNVFDLHAQTEARQRRDAHRQDFFRALVDLPPFGHRAPQFRDMYQPRLLDTWQDFWIMDVYLADDTQFRLGRSMAKVYLSVLTIFLVAGLTHFLVFQRPNSPWLQFGWLTLSIFVLFVGALAAYVYANPWGGALANKGIYVIPVIWTLGFLLTEFLRPLLHTRRSHILLFIGLAVLLIVHHALPMY